MRMQFTTSTIFFVVTFLAITLGAWMVCWKIDPSQQPISPNDFLGMLFWIAVLLPFWLPFAFVGYACGARRLTPRMCLGLALGEILAMALMCGAFWLLSDY